MSKRKQGAATALLLLAVGGWWTASRFNTPQPTPEQAPKNAVPVDPPHPAQTRRANALRSARQTARTVTMARPPEPADNFTLHIRLGDPGKLHHALSVYSTLPTSNFFPHTDEAPFPESEAVDLLQSYMDLEPDDPAKPASLDRFLAAAAVEELDTELIDDPWLGLVALEAKWHLATIEWVTLVRARTMGDRSPFPKLNNDFVMAQAEHLSHTDAAEFAALYVMQARSDPYSSARDNEAGTREALALLRTTDDALIASAAANLLLKTQSGAHLSLADIELLEQVWLGDDGLLVLEGIAILALEASLANGAPEHAAVWANRHAQATEFSCTPDICEVLRQDAAHSLARAAAIANADHVKQFDWQTAIRAAVWRCHIEGQTPKTPSFIGQAVWTDAWAWKSWSVDQSAADTLTSCIARAHPKGPNTTALLNLTLIVTLK